MATIKTQLEASGVSKFQQQMRQASGAVKAMGAELKVAEAAYQQTGDQAAYLAEKSSILKQQLEEQKKAVSAAEKALEQVKKQYGENSTQANAWRTKLAQARATLIQTETAIKNTDSALDALGKDDVSGVAEGLEDVDKKAQGAKKSADDLGESVGNIEQKLDVQAITGAIDKITNGFDRVIQKAAQMGKAIWDASTDAASWADATRDAATAAHMSTTEYQQLGYAAQFFGTSVEDLTKAQGRMSKAMASADDEVIAVGDSLVNTMTWVEDGMGGYIRKKRSWSDVLLDTLDALGGIEDASERDALAMELFGKSYSDLNGIIEGGTDAFRKRMNEAPVVQESTVNSLADTADKVKDMNSQLEVLKLELLNALSPSIQTIADAVGSLAQQLTAFVQSEEGQKLLAQLGESIQTIVTNLTGTDFEKTVEAAAKVLGDLNGAFDWISEHYMEVAIAIGVIAGAVGALKIASLGLTLTNSILSLKNLVGAGNGGTGTGTTLVPHGGTGTTGTTVMSPNGTPTMLTKVGLVGLAAQLWEQGPEGQLARHTQETYGHSVMTGSEAAQELTSMMQSMGEAQVQQAEKAGEDTGKGYATGLVNSRSVVEAAATNIAGGPLNIIKTMLEIHSPSRVMEELGVMAGLGFANGLASTSGAVAAAASALAAAAAINGALSSVGGGSARGSANGAGNYNANSNLYIGTYNQNGGGDVSALASAMAAAQSQMRRGFGARR